MTAQQKLNRLYGLVLFAGVSDDVREELLDFILGLKKVIGEEGYERPVTT